MFLKLNYRPFGRFGDFNQYENTKREKTYCFMNCEHENAIIFV